MPVERINIYNDAEIAGIRAAARVAARVLEQTCEAVRPGISTLELDTLAGHFIKEAGAVSSAYNYYGYPGQICVSINDEVVHGIGRADRIVQPGDLVKLDVAVGYKGFYGDNARTVFAGGHPEGLGGQLMSVTRKCLLAGIERAREGNCLNDIGTVIERIANASGFSPVHDMCGHGCGRHMHEPPEVLNYAVKHKTVRLRAGMVICIEPMINAGGYRVTIDRNDKWTCRSADHSLSAHFEHQVLITGGDPEILTRLS